ncbi:MAG: hypothetical protein QXZ28_04315 [Candidatus Methanomethylicaceae archaeon]
MKSKQGFSIFELFVVVVLINIITAVAIPSIQRFYRTYKYIEYASRMEHTVRWARIIAMERSINVSVCIEENNRITVRNMGTSRAYPCIGEEITHFDTEGNNFISISGSDVSFDPKGFAIQPGNVCITNGSSYTRAVISRFGAIRLERGSGTCT